MGEPVRIVELARAMIELSGLDPDHDIDIEIVGARGGEKIHEELFNSYEHPRPTSAEKILLAERPPLAAEAVESMFAEIGLLVLEGDAAGLAAKVSELSAARRELRRTETAARRVRPNGGMATARCACTPHTLPRFMTLSLLALSLSNTFTQIGAIAAFAALLGIAVLSLLFFSQARELKRLREWAGRAPERSAELEQRVTTAAAARVQQPAPAVRPVPRAAPISARPPPPPPARRGCCGRTATGATRLRPAGPAPGARPRRAGALAGSPAPRPRVRRGGPRAAQPDRAPARWRPAPRPASPRLPRRRPPRRRRAGRARQPNADIARRARHRAPQRPPPLPSSRPHRRRGARRRAGRLPGGRIPLAVGPAVPRRARSAVPAPGTPAAATPARGVAAARRRAGCVGLARRRAADARSAAGPSAPPRAASRPADAGTPTPATAAAAANVVASASPRAPSPPRRPPAPTAPRRATAAAASAAGPPVPAAAAQEGRSASRGGRRGAHAERRAPNASRRANRAARVRRRVARPRGRPC